MESSQTISISKWLFYGSGFGLIVLALSLALSPLAIAYMQNQEEQKRFQGRKIVALTALEAEAKHNQDRVKENIESTKQAAERRSSFPSLIRYRTTVWNGVSGSQELLSLPPNDFTTVALIYGQLEDANRRFAAWEDRFTVSPFSFGSLSEIEWKAWEQYRKVEVRNLQTLAEGIERNLPLIVEVARKHLKVAEIELRILGLQSWPNLLLKVSFYAVVLPLTAAYIIFGIVNGMKRRQALGRTRTKWTKID